MRITQGAIREILEDYNKKRNVRLELPDNIIREIQDWFEESYEIGDGVTPPMFVIDCYEQILLECEHEDYDICDDEEDEYNGQGDFIRTNKYQYAVCRICGCTAPVRTVETGEGYDQEFGQWEKENDKQNCNFYNN